MDDHASTLRRRAGALYAAAVLLVAALAAPGRATEPSAGGEVRVDATDDPGTPGDRAPEVDPGGRGAAPGATRDPAPTTGADAGTLLVERLPAPLVEIRFLRIRLWQWIALLALVVAAATLSWLAVRLLAGVGRTIVQRSRSTLDDALLEASGAPVRLAVAVVLFSAGTRLLALAAPVRRFFGNVEQVVAIAAATWLLLRLADVLARTAERRFLQQGKMAATSVVPLGRRTVKSVLVVLAIVATLQNLGFNVTGILAGLGIGGLAVALAAQKTVENLFGGVTLIADQPVRVGDFCRFGDRLGIVEDIGLRSTRVRTLDRTLVTVPNAQFASLSLENFTRRDRIWLHETIGLRYETSPDQLRHVLVELKKLLLGHPRIEPDPARVRFVGFGAYSLDLELFAYVRTTDYGEFLAVREDVLLRVMDVVAASGTSFAFPSQTIYAGGDSGLDQTRRQAAEAEVERWRAQQGLFLPDVPAEAATRLTGRLDYPPTGSASLGRKAD